MLSVKYPQVSFINCLAQLTFVGTIILTNIVPKWYQSHLHNNYIDLSSLPVLWYFSQDADSLFHVIHET
jgi:hypothetical protein